MKSDQFAVDPDALRQAMRHWATGVTIVSSHYNGVRHGMTVSSFTSISLEPPLVLISVGKGARTHELVQRSGYFSVTLLDQSQQQISERFAGRITESQDRFAGLETFELTTGAPFLRGGLSFLDCEVMAVQEAGDNTLFIGRVIDLQIGQNGAPLIYYDQGYRQLAPGDPG